MDNKTSNAIQNNIMATQNALGVVAQWISQEAGVRITWNNGSACEADMKNRTLSIPRLVESDMLSGDKMWLCRAHIYHEAGHLAESKLDDRVKDEGLHIVLNALEDRRMERVIAGRYTGCGVAFRKAIAHYNAELAERFTNADDKAKTAMAIYEALCACSFEVENTTPAWTLSDEAAEIHDLIRKDFGEVFGCRDTKEATDLAIRIWDKIKKEQENKQNQNQNGDSDENEDSDDDSEQSDSEQSQGGGSGNSEQSQGQSKSEGDTEEQSEGQSKGGDGDSKQSKGQPQSESGDDGSEDQSKDGEGQSQRGQSNSKDGNGDEDSGTEGQSKDGEGDSEQSKDDGKNGQSNSKDGEADEKGEQSEGDSEGQSKDGNGESMEDIAKALSEIAKQYSRDAVEGDAFKKIIDEQNANSAEPYTACRTNDRHVAIGATPSDNEGYKEALLSCNSEAALLARTLEEYLKSVTRTKMLHCQRRGKLDPRRYAVMAKGLSKEVFKHLSDKRDLDTAVEIIFDESGSMSEYREVRKAIMIIAEALERVHIPFEITGGTTLGWGDGVPRGFTRANPIEYRHYKVFDQNWIASRAALMHSGAFRNYIDGEVLEYAASRLAARKEKRKIVFSLSDGCPCGGEDCHKDEQLAAKLKKTCGECRKAGIEVYSFAIDTSEPAKWYGREFSVVLRGNGTGEESLGACLSKGITNVMVKGRVA